MKHKKQGAKVDNLDLGIQRAKNMDLHLHTWVVDV
jgi:hypothetical protein